MTLSYRSRRILRRLLITALILILVLAVAWVVWLLWLDRYVVYSRDGAKLDFTLSNQSLSGQPAVPPENDVTISIYYNEGENALDTSTEMTQLSGYYITTDMLTSDISAVRSQVGALPAGTPVLIDVKDIVGRFFYTSALGDSYSKIDAAAMDELIAYMDSRGLYLIARTPAFRDYNYARAHTGYGLWAPGGYLWMDKSRCYWLSPGSDGALSYLMQIVSELKGLGFDEVAFKDFCFPDTKDITFKGGRAETLATAAEAMVSASSSDRFTVSFITDDPEFPLPEGRCRIYMADQAAADAKSLAEQTGLEDPAVRLVFLTEVNDTRFDDYGALRPITSAN